MEEILKLLINSDLKLIEKVTGIPYDRMYKWKTGKGKPKMGDFHKLKDYFAGNSSISTEETPQYSIDAIPAPPRAHEDPAQYDVCVTRVPMYNRLPANKENLAGFIWLRDVKEGTVLLKVQDEEVTELGTWVTIRLD